MKKKICNIILTAAVLLVIPALHLAAQDNERPLPPLFTLLTVDPLTGNTILTWTPGGSPDVAGYVFYDFREGAGEAFDTIRIPALTSYTDTRSNASLFSVSYFVAAIDSSDNISPLSNSLSTIFITAEVDSCMHGIDIEWTLWNDPENQANSYSILQSRDGSTWSLAGEVQGTVNSFFQSEIESGSHYCFYLEAELSDGNITRSNSACAFASLERRPEWINGDFAKVDENLLTLSFTYDDESEITRFRIEESLRRDGPFTETDILEAPGGRILLEKTPVPLRPVYYRAVALNSCNEGVTFSNPVSLIHPIIDQQENLLLISWNRYHDWIGGVDRYNLYRDHGAGFTDIATIDSADTIFADNIHNFQYLITADSVCYYVKASEGFNPYFTGAESVSPTVCLGSPVKIFAPTAFTPDGNGLNELFSPVLSFTPSVYRLIIRDKRGALIFESSDHMESWNGTVGGQRLPEDIFFWFLEATTPDGAIINRHGTVTIIHN
ncbi:MAG: gliding motility-associated C-terminal domain-containing protein [Bacteroidales bacterium]|nr:gliding motility-associated C-terminal domain-containing protein [Bacteroidales bacterium]